MAHVARCVHSTVATTPYVVWAHLMAHVARCVHSTVATTPYVVWAPLVTSSGVEASPGVVWTSFTAHVAPSGVVAWIPSLVAHVRRVTHATHATRVSGIPAHVPRVYGWASRAPTHGVRGVVVHAGGHAGGLERTRPPWRPAEIPEIPRARIGGVGHRMARAHLAHARAHARAHLAHARAHLAHGARAHLAHGARAHLAHGARAHLAHVSDQTIALLAEDLEFRVGGHGAVVALQLRTHQRPVRGSRVTRPPRAPGVGHEDLHHLVGRTPLSHICHFEGGVPFGVSVRVHYCYRHIIWQGA